MKDGKKKHIIRRMNPDGTIYETDEYCFLYEREAVISKVTEKITDIIRNNEILDIKDLDIDCSIVSYGQGVGIDTYC